MSMAILGRKAAVCPGAGEALSAALLRKKPQKVSATCRTRAVEQAISDMKRDWMLRDYHYFVE